MKMLLKTKDNGYAGDGDKVYWYKDTKLKEGRITELRVEYGEFYDAQIEDYGCCYNTYDFETTFYLNKPNDKEQNESI